HRDTDEMVERPHAAQVGFAPGRHWHLPVRLCCQCRALRQHKAQAKAAKNPSAIRSTLLVHACNPSFPNRAPRPCWRSRGAALTAYYMRPEAACKLRTAGHALPDIAQNTVRSSVTNARL